MKKMITVVATVATISSMTAIVANAASTKLDVNSDGKIDSVDVCMVLEEYAALSAGKKSTFNKTQPYIADYNSDGVIDSIDAVGIMHTYIMNSVDKPVPVTTIEFSAYAVIPSGGMEHLATYSSYEEAWYTIQWHKEGALMRGTDKYNYKIAITETTPQIESSQAIVKTKFVYSE